MTSFDRAAEYYDATRALPAEIAAALTELLTAELEGRGRSLEIGVGTGRIAIPLQARGLSLVGADISAAMLDRLVRNAGGTHPFPLLLADAGRMPLATASMGAVLASHVLHLLPDWRRAVDEALRVLGDGGVLLADFGVHPVAPWNEAAEAHFHRHGIERVRPGVSDPDEVAEHLGSRVSVRPLRPLTMRTTRSLAQDLADWEQQTHSWTWAYPNGQLLAACRDIRRWARRARWPLGEEFPLERTLQWWAFDRR